MTFNHFSRVFAIGLVTTAFVAPAKAGFITFGRINGNADENVASQLLVEVKDLANGKASFTFWNIGDTDSRITDIYFDDDSSFLAGPPADISISDESDGVKFALNANPGNLPSGNDANPAFVTTAGFSADSQNSPFGIDQSALILIGDQYREFLTLTVGLKTTYAELLAGLATANSPAYSGEMGFRIGLHVSSIGISEDSDAFVSNGYSNDLPPQFGNGEVPEPASVAMWLTAAVGGAFAARRKSKKAAC